MPQNINYTVFRRFFEKNLSLAELNGLIDSLAFNLDDFPATHKERSRAFASQLQRTGRSHEEILAQIEGLFHMDNTKQRNSSVRCVLMAFMDDRTIMVKSSECGR